MPENAPFRTLVDRENRLGRTVGTTLVPNGLLLDEEGRLAWTSFGETNVAAAEQLAVVRAFAEGQRSFGQPGEGPDGAKARSPEEADAAQAAGFHFERGARLLAEGKAQEAVAAWREALRRQPDNYIIRKQIWRVEHPERFEPEIDWTWQREQLARELEAETT